MSKEVVFMEDKKKIAIIGATEFQLPLIRKAKELEMSVKRKPIISFR